MGFYIQTGSLFNKANLIATRWLGKVVDQATAQIAVKDTIKNGVVVVVNTGKFEAAAFAPDEKEFLFLTKETDLRPKQFVIIPRDIAEIQSNYTSRNNPFVIG